MNTKIDLLEGLRQYLRLDPIPWGDSYFSTMARTDWLDGKTGSMATKSFHIRSAPFGGSYGILFGLTEYLRALNDYQFDARGYADRLINRLGYDPAFARWLESQQQIKAIVYAPREGTIFLPHEPIVSVFAPRPHIRLAEGALLKALNFPVLVGTKWRRLVDAVLGQPVYDFSWRRAQDPFRSSLYAMLAGCAATSNENIGWFFDHPVVGSTGHEYMQSYGRVEDGFRTWLQYNPNRPFGLVDTVDCLRVDFPAWLEAVYEFREQIKAANPKYWGWRNDSGDLAYLTIEQYRMFLAHPLSDDPWFVEHLRIIETNDIDEYVAEKIINQIRTYGPNAGIEAEKLLKSIIWAAGTKPGTCDGQPNLGGIAKLQEIDGDACMKLAFGHDGRPSSKTSIPGFNLSADIFGSNGKRICVLVYPARDWLISPNGLMQYHNNIQSTLRVVHPDVASKYMDLQGYFAIARQQVVFDNIHGTGFTPEWEDSRPTITGIHQHIEEQLQILDWSERRTDTPHNIKLSLTPDLFELRQRMITQRVLRSDLLE